MENYLLPDNIEKNQQLLEGTLFTHLQMGVLKKRLNNKPLTRNEKTYYYSYIRPKLNAALSLADQGNHNLSGAELILPKRLENAKKLVAKLEKRHKKKRILISGSYLFSRSYHDIDAFIFTKYHKEDYKKGKLHVSFLPESSIETLFFSSLSKICVANFALPNHEPAKIGLADLLQDYELLINHLLKKEPAEKELRDFLLKAEFISKGTILSPRQLYNLKNKILARKSSGIISEMLINSLVLGYTRSELKKALLERLKDYQHLKRQYPSSENLKIYTKTYRRAIELET